MEVFKAEVLMTYFSVVKAKLERQVYRMWWAGVPHHSVCRAQGAGHTGSRSALLTPKIAGAEGLT